MDKFIINGGKKLTGTISVSGAKNAILPIMTATLLAKGKSTLSNVPTHDDIQMMANLLRALGAKVEFENGTLTIDSTRVNSHKAPYELVSKMRASIYVLGPLLTIFGKAKVSFPGGCAIGTRPVDLHLKAMESFGTKTKIENGYILANCKLLKGAEIFFEKVSVGATCNALMTAVLANGTTNIYNAAKEPEIANLIDFLNKMGAKIEGQNSSTLKVFGVKKLQPIAMKMMPDRIEAGTFLITAAATNSKITVQNCNAAHLQILINKLREIGCIIKIDENSIELIPPKKIKAINVQTLPYPGFPTDLQAQFMALMTLSNGTSIIEDTIFPDRFIHVAELNRLDANIKVNKNIATVTGVKKMSGAEIMASDLRASAALVIAGLAAKGKTTISRIYHIDRGYDKIEKKLQKIGADITRVKS